MMFREDWRQNSCKIVKDLNSFLIDWTNIAVNAVETKKEGSCFQIFTMLQAFSLNSMKLH
jgi:hypothetical protein